MRTIRSIWRNPALILIGFILLLYALRLFLFFYNSEFIINRDPTNYWFKALFLSDLIAEQGFENWLETIVASFPDNHTLLPSTLPSLTVYMTGNEGALLFSIVCMLIYTAPTIFLIAIVANQTTGPQSLIIRLASLLCITAVTFPITILVIPTVPDVGGMLLISLSVLVYQRLFQLTAPDSRNTTSVLRYIEIALLVFIYLCLLFFAVIFRRWYGFFAVSHLAVSASFILYVIFMKGFSRNAFACLTACLVGILIFVGLFFPLIQEKMLVVTVSKVLVGIYDLYRRGYIAGLMHINVLIWLTAFATLILTLLAFRRSGRLLGLYGPALFGSIIGIALFLSVQRMGTHHLILFILPFGICAGLAFSYVQKRFERDALTHNNMLRVTIIGALVIIVISFPIKQEIPFFESYVRLGRILNEMKLKNNHYCVIGSREVYFSIVENLWQVVPNASRRNWPKPFRIPEVDLGLEKQYKFIGISQCDWMITQRDLILETPKRYHKILRYFHQALLSRTSEVGRRYRFVRGVQIGFSSPVLFFKRLDGYRLRPSFVRPEYLKWMKTANHDG